MDSLFLAWQNDADADALAAVYDAMAPVLLRIALHHVRHPAAAEDLVQATFLAAIEGSNSYHPDRPLQAWLVGILRNQARWLMRREGRSIDAARVDERAERDPLEGAAGTEFTAQVDAAIDAVPEVYRSVMRLHLRHDMNAAEIAHALDRPAGTVRSQVVRGLELLRAALPAGLAMGTAFSALLPARGLAAVREVVLESGRHLAATSVVGSAAGAVAMTASWVAMKKFAAVLLAVALVVIGAVSLPRILDFGVRPALDPSVASQNATSVPEADVVVNSSLSARTAAARIAGSDRSAVAATPSWRLHGTVSVAGIPTAGARVRVALPGHHDPRWAEVEADANGSYEVDLEPLRELPRIDLERVHLGLRSWAPGSATVHVGVTLPHWDTTQALELQHDIELTAAAIVVGRVVDERQRPVFGASVVATSSTRSVIKTSTDFEGVYRLAVAEAGSVHLDARHSAHGVASVSATCRVGSDTAVEDLVLHAANRLLGRLVLDDGQPAARVSVVVANRYMMTDEQGRFSFAMLAPGRYPVEVARQAVGTLETGSPEKTIVLSGYYLILIDFADDEGRALRPMAGGARRFDASYSAELYALAAGGALTNGVKSKMSVGAIDVFLRPAGSWLWVTASHKAYHGEVLIHAEARQSVIRRTMELVSKTRDALLRLHLVGDDNGGPVDELRVHLEQVRLGDPRVYRLEPKSGVDPADGILLAVPSGQYRLRVESGFRSEGMFRGCIQPLTRIVNLRSGQETVVRDRFAVGGRVSLTVRVGGAEQGAKLPGFELLTDAARDAPVGRRKGFTSRTENGWSSGRIRIGQPGQWEVLLPPGQHLLTIRARGFLETHVSVQVKARKVCDVEVTLQPR